MERLSLCRNVGSSILAKSSGVLRSDGVQGSVVSGRVMHKLKGECMKGSNVASAVPPEAVDITTPEVSSPSGLQSPVNDKTTH